MLGAGGRARNMAQPQPGGGGVWQGHGYLGVPPSHAGTPKDTVKSV